MDHNPDTIASRNRGINAAMHTPVTSMHPGRSFNVQRSCRNNSHDPENNDGINRFDNPR